MNEKATEQVLKALAENQKHIMETVIDLKKENIDLKSQLIEKNQKVESDEPTEAELDLVFKDLRV